jgi:hypothetical protein
MPRYAVSITVGDVFDADDVEGAIDAAMAAFRDEGSDLDSRELYTVTEVDTDDIFVNPDYLRPSS